MAELEQKAGYGLVIAMSITAMIGTGIFFGPAIAASWAGPASVFAWVLLALITVYVGYCFAELSSLFPDVGGVYAFAKKAYGRFPSFLVGWVTLLVGTITPAVIIAAAVDTLRIIFTMSDSSALFVAIGLILVLNYTAYRGIEASTFILIFFAVVTVGVLLLVFVAGSFQFQTANFTPFFTRSPLFIFVALFFIMETFFGWESATFMGSETRNPQKIIPRAIVYTTILVAVISVLFVVVILGLFPAQTLAGYEVPIIQVSQQLFGQTGMHIVLIAVVLSLIGSAAGGIVSSPRLILALAKDRLFIEQLSAIHPKNRTPYKAILFQTIVSLLVLFAAFGDYQSLLSILVPLALFMYISIILTVPILRKRYPAAHREFTVPMVKTGTIFVSLFYLAVIVLWLVNEPNAWPLFRKILSFIFFGVPIYLLLNIYYNPDWLFKAINSFAYFNRLFEGFLLPRSVRKQILGTFSSLRGKSVLEIGAGVGTLTVPLLEAVGKEGRVVVTDVSKNNLSILSRRTKAFMNITLIHDVHLISRVHPDVPSVEAVFSVGNLSYIQDVRRVLKDVYDRLPENGPVVFVDYVDYFWGIIPNQPWLDDEEKVRALFRDAGFSVRIHKRSSLLWKYLFVYGLKCDRDVPVI